jgi:beta-lactamase regulating signal transducer with metallopeptidase domain
MNGTNWARLWDVAGWTMLHYLWVGGVAGVLAAARRWLLRVGHPDIRYGYALVSLGILAIAPVLIAYEISHGVPARVIGPRVISAFSPPGAVPATVARGSRAVTGATSVPRPQAAAVGRQLTLSLPAGIDPSLTGQWLATAAMALPAIWLVGAPLTIAYLAAGLLGAERLRRQSWPECHDKLTRLCNRLAIALGVAHWVSVGIRELVTAPLLVGIVRPLILLPPAALAGWSPEKVEMALLHELAHVRRWDNLVNLIQRAAGTTTTD